MPTPKAALYEWHRSALHGMRPPSHESEPHCGWYLTRFTDPEVGWYYSPLVPGSIWLDQQTDPDTGELVADEVMRAEIEGEPWDPVMAWSWLSRRPICVLFYRQKLKELF